MTLKYFTKNVYGKELIYLADIDARQHWFVVSGGKTTINKAEMRRLTELTDVSFVRVFEPVGAAL